MSFPSDQDLEDVRKRAQSRSMKAVSINKDLLLAILADLRLRREQDNQARDEEDVPGLVAELNAVKALNQQLGDRVGAVYKELGALEAKAQITQDALRGYRATEEYNKSTSFQLTMEIKRLKEKYLAFICAECGATTHNFTDSIDNGTSLKCDQCKKESVVSLRRLSEKDGEELHRVAEWVMWAREKMADHQRLLDETLVAYKKPEETLRDVVMRFKNTIDILTMGTKVCLGYQGHPHQFIMCEITRGCPVCDVTSRFG